MGKRSREKWQKRSGLLSPSPSLGEKFESQSGLEKIYLSLIRWGVYFVLFAPLIILTQFFFPFVAPKTAFFRIVVEIIFVPYVLLLVSNSRYRPRINILTIVLTLFLGVFILASLAGINFERSFWSTYERMTGIWTMVHLFAFFLILTSCFKRKEDWEKFFGVSVLVGAFLSIYILRGNELSTRGGGTIGNTSFMAAYLLFDIFFAIILFLSNFLKKEGWSLFWQIYSGLSLLIMLPVFFKSSARGAIASFEIGLFLIALGYLLFSGRRKLKRLGFALILCFFLLAGAAIVFQPDFLKGKIALTIEEMRPRFAVWQIGFSGWQERPVLGWGPENFNVVFNKYFNPCLFLRSCGGEIWFDRVHNIVLDTMTTTGLMGLVSYFTIFGAAIFGLIRLLTKIADKSNLFLPLAAIALLLAYFLQNLLVFDMINSYLVFFLTLGFVGFLTTESRETKEIKSRKINPVIVAFISLFMILVVWFGNIKPAIAGHYLVRSIGTQNLAEAVTYFQKSLDSWMNKYEAREHFTQRISRISSYPVSDKENLFKALELATKEMEKGVRENSLDFRPHLFLSKLYNVSYQLSQDQEQLKLAQQYAEKAIGLSPGNQQGFWYLGEVKLVQGENDEAISLFQKAVDLEPEFSTAHWYLALAYKATGQNQLAGYKVLQAKALGYDLGQNLNDLQRAIEIFQALRDDAQLLVLYQGLLELRPGDVQTLASLAATYANLGQFDKAREVALQVKEKDPSLAPKIEEFLKSLPND